MVLVPDRDAAEYDGPVMMGLDRGDGCGDERVVDRCRDDNADCHDALRAGDGVRPRGGGRVGAVRGVGVTDRLALFPPSPRTIGAVERIERVAVRHCQQERA